MTKARFVSCPRCGAQVAWLAENRYRLIDLGDWAMEKYRVPDREQDKNTPDTKGED